MTENTIILALKIKISKDEYIDFNLRKYDDLFESLNKFVSLNKIKRELVKPLVLQIFKSINKIFYLFNNKISIYDQEYLNSLYKLYLKNNNEILRSNHKGQSSDKTSKKEKKIIHIKSKSDENIDNNNSEYDNECDNSIHSI